MANVYVDDDGNYRFVAVATGGFMGWLGTKHRLVPVEAIVSGDAGSIIESAPTFGDPHAAPDEALQRAAREHCGFAAVPPDP